MLYTFIRRDTRLTLLQRSVVAEILDHDYSVKGAEGRGKKGQSWPTQVRLAALLGVERTKVGKAVRVAEELGYWRIESFRAHAGTRLRYVINYDQIREWAFEAHQDGRWQAPDSEEGIEGECAHRKQPCVSTGHSPLCPQDTLNSRILNSRNQITEPAAPVSPKPSPSPSLSAVKEPEPEEEASSREDTAVIPSAPAISPPPSSTRPPVRLPKAAALTPPAPRPERDLDWSPPEEELRDWEEFGRRWSEAPGR